MNKNKIKVIPKLRFPIFRNTEGWRYTKLSEISNRITEKVGDLKLTTLSISAGVGFISQTEKFSRDISGNQSSNYIHLRKGDFSYNKGNSKKFPQGCIYELREFKDAAVPNAFISFRFFDDFVSNFYNGYFDNNYHGKQLIKYISSGVRSDVLLNISPDDFFSIILPTPHQKAEQQKIADCLSSIDKLIELENKKLETLKKYKKGLMQKLFPADEKSVPEWRFPEFRNSKKWVPNTIGKACTSYSGGTPDTSKEEYYDGEIPFIRSGEIGKDKTELCITEKGLHSSSAKMVAVGDVLVALYGANSGEAALSKIEGAINQAILCLRHKTNNAFVYQYLSHKKSWITTTYLQGRQGNLSGTIIKSIKLFFTSPEEQQKIADCLLEIDNLISSQSQKIEKLNTHKKGLMQGLFPSIEEVYK